jgi:hypothetical protein
MYTDAILHMSCICVQCNATGSVALFTHPSFVYYIIRRETGGRVAFFSFSFCVSLYLFLFLSSPATSYRLRLCLSRSVACFSFSFSSPLSLLSLVCVSLSLKAPSSSFSLSLSLLCFFHGTSEPFLSLHCLLLAPLLLHRRHYSR